MAEKNEVTYINGSQGKLTLNFQGAFPQNKSAVKGGKFNLTTQEEDWLKASYPNLFEGDEKRLYKEGENIPTEGAMGQEELKAFFNQPANAVKKALRELDEKQLEEAYNYSLLHDDAMTDATRKELEKLYLESGSNE